eukprot:s4720_g4.t1
MAQMATQPALEEDSGDEKPEVTNMCQEEEKPEERRALPEKGQMNVGTGVTTYTELFNCWIRASNRVKDNSWMKAKKNKRNVAEMSAGNGDVGQMLGLVPPQDSPVQPPELVQPQQPVVTSIQHAASAVAPATPAVTPVQPVQPAVVPVQPVTSVHPTAPAVAPATPAGTPVQPVQPAVVPVQPVTSVQPAAPAEKDHENRGSYKFYKDVLGTVANKAFASNDVSLRTAVARFDEAVLASTYVWSVNYKPHGSGAFGEEKYDLLSSFFDTCISSLKLVADVVQKLSEQDLEHFQRYRSHALDFEADFGWTPSDEELWTHMSESELQSFLAKKGLPKPGKWFAWHACAHQRLKEYFATRCLLDWCFEDERLPAPEEVVTQFQKSKSDLGGLKLLYRALSYVNHETAWIMLLVMAVEAVVVRRAAGDRCRRILKHVGVHRCRGRTRPSPAGAGAGPSPAGPSPAGPRFLEPEEEEEDDTYVEPLQRELDIPQYDVPDEVM